MSRTATADSVLVPDIEAFAERVVILIHQDGIPTDNAEDPAAQGQGFRIQAHYWAWLRVYVDRKRLGYESLITKTKAASQSGGLGMLFYFFAKMVRLGGPTSSYTMALLLKSGAQA